MPIDNHVTSEVHFGNSEPDFQHTQEIAHQICGEYLTEMLLNYQVICKALLGKSIPDPERKINRNAIK